MRIVNRTFKVLKEEGLRGILSRTIKAWRRLLNSFISTREGNLDTATASSDKRRIFILATVPYHDVGGGQRSAQLAKTFSRHGFSVYYIYAQLSSEAKVLHMTIPTVMHRYIKRIKLRDVSERVREDDIAIVEIPHEDYIPLIEVFLKKQAKIIYESIDNWETSLGKGLLSEDCLRLLLKKANALVATSKPLRRQMESYLNEMGLKRKVSYLSNAVDDDLFDPSVNYPIPPDLQDEKYLLYYGSLWGDWFDWNMLSDVAKELDDWKVVLIGDDSNVRGKVKYLPSNIVFLGSKPQTQLPLYLYHARIAVLPFAVGEIGDYVSPLKIFEYIAMHKPVLSTNLPDIVGYPNVYTGNNSTQWTDVVRSGLWKKVDTESAKSFTHNNSWKRRCDDLVALIDKKSK